MSFDALKTELAKSDYDDLIAAGNHAEIAVTLNAKTVSLLRPVSSASLLAWSAQNNRFRKIEAATADVNSPVYSLASAAMLLIRRDGTELDLNLPDRVAMLSALVGAGVLEQSDADAITTLATVVVPWSSTFGIVEIGVGHVINALREMESA